MFINRKEEREYITDLIERNSRINIIFSNEGFGKTALIGNIKSFVVKDEILNQIFGEIPIGQTVYLKQHYSPNENFIFYVTVVDKITNKKITNAISIGYEIANHLMEAVIKELERIY